MFSALSHASRTGQKGCSNIIARKPVPQVKLYHNHYGGAVPRSNVIFWRHSVCIRKLQEPRSESTQIKMEPHSITMNEKEMRGVRKGKGKMRGLTFWGRKRKRRDNHFLSVSHSIWGADSSPYRDVLETKEALDTRAL